MLNSSDPRRSSANHNMKAIQLTRNSPDQPPTIEVTIVPLPANTPGHVVVKIEASAIQPSDRLNSKGSFDHTTFPRIPGRDFSGVIVDGPSDRIGQEVFGTSGMHLGFTTDGPHAEYCLTPEEAVVAKPHNLSFTQAATVGVPFTTALMCLTRARASSDDTVLILGAHGAVGSAAIQIARVMGCKRVLGAVRDDKSDINTQADPELNTVKTLTQGKGVDVVIDTVGDFSLMQAAINQLAERGRYAIIAAPRGPGASTVFGLDILQTYRRGIELIGCNSVGLTLSEIKSSLSALKDWFEKGSIVAKGEDEFETVSLEEAAEVYQAASGKTRIIAKEGYNRSLPN